ncbi:hypothetical protein B0H34DRAFT_717537 [Crassisporium funariophilum]|nr:hypothetical protein B0H34DRAFT_717537 [Crassisporium funariophilum]
MTPSANSFHLQIGHFLSLFIVGLDIDLVLSIICALKSWRFLEHLALVISRRKIVKSHGEIHNKLGPIEAKIADVKSTSEVSSQG